MLCSALSGSSEDEDDGEGRPADCDPRRSAAKDYLVQAVSQLHLYRQVPSTVDTCPGVPTPKHFPPECFTAGFNLFI